MILKWELRFFFAKWALPRAFRLIWLELLPNQRKSSPFGNKFPRFATKSARSPKVLSAAIHIPHKNLMLVHIQPVRVMIYASAVIICVRCFYRVAFAQMYSARWCKFNFRGRCCDPVRAPRSGIFSRHDWYPNFRCGSKNNERLLT